MPKNADHVTIEPGNLLEGGACLLCENCGSYLAVNPMPIHQFGPLMYDFERAHEKCKARKESK